MAAKQKPHDLRDDIYAPPTTVTNTNERLAGAEPASVDPENGNLKLVRPALGSNVPPGQTTKG
ncbi:MAG TPA: hypothetical protein VNU97_05320 [Rhizomicrobium sp.]|jgi:hypothetical protein|nr:hypothetical protein [Rhizomicrobium sp.]